MGSAIKKGVVVDIGANGRQRSNSYDLMLNFGWRGVLVEANPKLINQIENDFRNLDFVLFNCAVSDKEGTMPFHIGVNDDVSSLILKNAEYWGDTRGTIDVNVRRIGSILSESRIPLNFDVLSIDIEGCDVFVINDMINNTNYLPKLIITETSEDFANKTLDDVDFCDKFKKLYKLIYQTRANMIIAKA